MNKICTITVKDEVYSYVSGLDDSEQAFLVDKLSKHVEGYRFMPLFQMGVWDGRKPFFGGSDGKIYTRLLDKILPYIEKWGYDIDLQDKRRPINLITTRVDKDWFLKKPGMPFNVELRPYQVKAINACLDNQSGFILAATGAGKCLHGTTPITATLPRIEKSKNGEAEDIVIIEEVNTNFDGLFTEFEARGKFFTINKPVDISDLGVMFPTPDGWQPAIAAVKKYELAYSVIVSEAKEGVPHRIRCADGHIFIVRTKTSKYDHTGTLVTTVTEVQKKANELFPGDMLVTATGEVLVISSGQLTEQVLENGKYVYRDVKDYFYDVSINTLDKTSKYVNTYFDSYGILHHNTWMVAGLTDVLATNDVRSLVIVPSDDLVVQTVQTLKDALLDVGTYSGTKKDIHHMVVVATWQALQNNLPVVAEFQAIIVDEAHGAKAKVIGDLINVAGGHIPYRFGFTGTMPKPEIDMLTLLGSIGEELFSITAAELMALGYLAELTIEPIELSENVEEDFPDYASEKSFLSKSKTRMDFLADFIIAKTDEYGNNLILVNSVSQGKALAKLIKGSVFLHGEDKTNVRQEWYKMFDTRDDLIVIATYGIASTGLSIDRIACLTMIDAGKSFVRAIQSIGRGLRIGGGKTKVRVFEVYSTLKWSKKHWTTRRKYYKEATYNVLKPTKFNLKG